jgi:DNA-binding CsgD family transcriptional regulator
LAEFGPVSNVLRARFRLLFCAFGPLKKSAQLLSAGFLLNSGKNRSAEIHCCDAHVESARIQARDCKKRPCLVATEPSTDPTIDNVLRAICMATSDAWCYAPVGSDAITHCSAEFLEFLQLDRKLPTELGQPIQLGDAEFQDRLNRIGLPPEWVRLKLAGQLQLESYSRVDRLSGFTLTSRMIRGSDNRTAGVLLFIRRETELDVPVVSERARRARAELAVLSAREKHILNLVASGLTNKAVARAASISEKTVEKHRANIMRKLGLRSVASLVRRVTEASLVSDDWKV